MSTEKRCSVSTYLQDAHCIHNRHHRVEGDVWLRSGLSSKLKRRTKPNSLLVPKRLDDGRRISKACRLEDDLVEAALLLHEGLDRQHACVTNGAAQTAVRKLEPLLDGRRRGRTDGKRLRLWGQIGRSDARLTLNVSRVAKLVQDDCDPASVLGRENMSAADVSSFGFVEQRTRAGSTCRSPGSP